MDVVRLEPLEIEGPAWEVLGGSPEHGVAEEAIAVQDGKVVVLSIEHERC